MHQDGSHSFNFEDNVRNETHFNPTQQENDLDQNDLDSEMEFSQHAEYYSGD